MTDEELLDLCERREAASEAIDNAQSEKDTLSSQIGTELALRGVNKLPVGPFDCAIVDADRRTLNKLRLIEKGVDPDLLDECSDVSHSTSVRVTRRRGHMPVPVAQA